MDYVSGDEFLQDDDVAYSELEVPGGKLVRIRSLRADESSLLGKAMEQYKDLGSMIIWAGLCMVDGEGKNLYKFEDLPKLGKKNLATIHKIGKAAAALNGVTDEAQEETKKPLPETGEEDSVSN